MKCFICRAEQVPGTGFCENGHPMSVVDDSLDRLVEAASVPSLSTLFRRAKEKGVIGAVSNYGEGKPKA